ncbi:MAG: hypothetical protein U0R49_01325 [Fimbriimonadales bacterium]
MKIAIWLKGLMTLAACAFAVAPGAAQIPNVPHPDRVPPDGSTAANPQSFRLVCNGMPIILVMKRTALFAYPSLR